MMLRPPRDNIGREMCHKPVTMENLGWIRQFCYSNLDNLLVLNETTAIEEAILYRANGGGTIVDATTIGIGRNPSALARISKESGINIVMGAVIMSILPKLMKSVIWMSNQLPKP